MQKEVKLYIVIIEHAPGSVACLKFHSVFMDAIGIHHPAWKVQSECRQVVHVGGCIYDGASRRTDGPPYFFLGCCFAEISPVPSQTGHTWPSLRPVPRQRAHRTEPVSFEFGMYGGSERSLTLNRGSRRNL